MQRVQEVLSASLLWRALMAISLWFGRQWEGSVVIHAFLNPSQLDLQVSRSSLAGRAWNGIHGGLSALYRGARLERVFGGSIFLQVYLWCALPVALAPLLPTMAVLALVLVSFCSMALTFAREGGRQLAFSAANRYILLYGALYMVGALSSVDRRSSLPIGLISLVFIWFALVVENAVATRRQADLLVDLVILAGTAVALYGIYQYIFRTGYNSQAWVDSDMFSISFRASSTLQNPNMLAEYLTLIIPLGGARLLGAKTWKERGLWLCCCGAMCICILLTFSRGGWVALLLAGLIFFLMLNPRLLFLAPVALVALYFVMPESVITRFTSIGNLADNSTSYRVSIWLGSLAMLKDYWLSGVGPGEVAFNMVYPLYGYDEVVAPHTHNLFLQILSDAGVCALIVFLLVLFHFFRGLCAALSREKVWRNRLVLIAVISGMCGFLAQGMTDYSFYNYRIMFLFWALLGLGAALSRLSMAPEGGSV